MMYHGYCALAHGKLMPATDSEDYMPSLVSNSDTRDNENEDNQSVADQDQSRNQRAISRMQRFQFPAVMTVKMTIPNPFNTRFEMD